MASVKDIYANIVSATADATSGTPNFTEVNLGISLGSKVGIIIDSIEYLPSLGLLNEFQDDGDLCVFGWSSSNSLSAPAISDSQVIDFNQMSFMAFGTPANGRFDIFPYKKSFLPPIIVASPRIYFYVDATGPNAGNVKCRLYFRYVELSTQEYLELAETFQLVGTA